MLATVFIIFVVETGLSLLLLIVLLPTWIYFFLRIFRKVPGFKLVFHKRHYTVMVNAFGVFTALLCLAVVIADLTHLNQLIEILFVLVFLPIVLHFGLEMTHVKHKLAKVLNVIKLSKSKQAKPTVSASKVTTAKAESREIPIESAEPITAGEVVTEYEIKEKEDEQVKERQRRQFIKLVVGAGAGVFLTSLLNPSKASAAFFGSSPGPGIMGIKDSSGNKIDPAIKSPTDGYGISNVDNASYPAFYGFVNRTGAWYILQENPQNTFLYSKGSTSFTTNWTSRASLTYTTYDVTFA